MRTQRALLFTSIAFIVAAFPAVAAATPTYPADVEADLTLHYTPPCTICHVGTPTYGSARTAFALAMKARGLIPLDDPTVATALTAMAADKVESDPDGTTDVQKLEDGCDPSTDAPLESGATCGGRAPLFGCVARIAPSAAPWQGAVALAAALGLALARRRRPRRRHRARITGGRGGARSERGPGAS